MNPVKLSSTLKGRVSEKFKIFRDCTLEDTFSEIGADTPEDVSLDKVKPDRRELDKIIMGDILGLTEDEQLEVYKAVIDIVKSRIEKAKSVDKKARTKDGIDLPALKIFLESYVTELYVPKDDAYLKSILPELETLKTKTDRFINSYLETIFNRKIRERLKYEVYMEVTK